MERITWPVLTSCLSPLEGIETDSRQTWLCENSFDAGYWYVVGYTLKAFQGVPTSQPTHILISGISIASRGVSSLPHFESSSGCNDSRKDVGFSSASRVASLLANFPERINLCLLEVAGLRFVGLPNLPRELDEKVAPVRTALSQPSRAKFGLVQGLKNNILVEKLPLQIQGFLHEVF